MPTEGELKQLISAALSRRQYSEAQRHLDIAVSAGYESLYGIQIQLWLADQWGPWPWVKIRSLLEQEAVRHPEAFWLLAKVIGQMGGDSSAVLLQGADAGSVQCALCLSVLRLLVRDVSGVFIDKDLSHETSKRIAARRVSDEGKEGIEAFLDKRPPSWGR